jgi:cytochrome b561
VSPVRSHVTRALHLGILLTVLHQLLSSVFMERPLPGEDPDWPYVLHTWVGAAGLAVLALFWLWTLARDRSETRLSALFPWFSPQRLHAIVHDVRGLIRDLRMLRMPGLEMNALASAFHGLGVTLATLMAGSGVAYLYLLGSPAARVVLQMHKLGGNGMWAYLIGHATMALVHQALGDNVFARMFWTRRPKQPIATQRARQISLAKRP